jgi:hypothetical protein
MRTTFSAWPEPARHEIVEGILSPEGLYLLWSPALPPQRRIWRCLAQQRQCIAFAKKLLKGIEPGRMLPLALENREKHNMGASDQVKT